MSQTDFFAKLKDKEKQKKQLLYSSLSQKSKELFLKNSNNQTNNQLNINKNNDNKMKKQLKLIIQKDYFIQTFSTWTILNEKICKVDNIYTQDCENTLLNQIIKQNYLLQNTNHGILVNVILKNKTDKIQKLLSYATNLLKQTNFNLSIIYLGSQNIDLLSIKQNEKGILTKIKIDNLKILKRLIGHINEKQLQNKQTSSILAIFQLSKNNYIYMNIVDNEQNKIQQYIQLDAYQKNILLKKKINIIKIQQNQTQLQKLFKIANQKLTNLQQLSFKQQQIFLLNYAEYLQNILTKKKYQLEALKQNQNIFNEENSIPSQRISMKDKIIHLQRQIKN